ncbi:MAG: HlyD family efflux transporter periplasmic adaptor subunit [Calothrix sp. MO_192.B10]|nr:HlyD family efflux transporter periplasmic adaptor subunit [Calothrix sp. MO_192.B10]
MMLDDTSPDNLRPVQSNEFLPSISAWETLGGLFLLATVAVGIGLAAIIEYPVRVRTKGFVRPTGEVRIVQATTTGVVERISAKENQEVKSGDAIATLSTVELQTQKSQILENIQQKKLQLTQLVAQIRILDTQIIAESDRANRSVASAVAQLKTIQRDYEQKRVTATSGVEEAATNIKIAQEELQQSQAELKSTQAQVGAIQAALQAAIIKRNRYQIIAESGSISQNQLEEAQLAVTQQQQALQSQQATVESQKQVVEKQQQALTAAEVRYKRALGTSSPSQAVVSIAEENIAQEQAKKAVSLAKLKQERKSLLQQQSELQNQLYSTQKELKKLENELGKTIIRATETGTILKLALRNPNQLVRTGDAVAEIAPIHAPIVIKARVAVQDISQVQICKHTLVKDCTQGKVDLRISTYPYPDYGTLRGVVRGITADAIAPLTTNDRTAAPYYEVTIEPITTYLEKNSQQYPLQAGMEVTADIMAQKETILRFILRKARLITDL